MIYRKNTQKMSKLFTPSCIQTIHQLLENPPNADIIKPLCNMVVRTGGLALSPIFCQPKDIESLKILINQCIAMMLK